MNLEAGLPFICCCVKDIPKDDFERKPRRWDSTDAILSMLTSARFTRWPNYAINADCSDASGASKMKVLGGYLFVRAAT